MSQPPASDQPATHDPVPTTAAVRLAWPREAGAIAAIQRRCWAETGRADLLAGFSDADLSEAWTQAIVAPPMAHFRVLVAHDGAGTLTGFAAIGPSDDLDTGDQDAEIAEFAVDPAARGQGHGSRLLWAAVDTLRSDGYQRAVWWMGATDDQLRAFAVDSGWGADGAHREIALAGPDASASARPADPERDATVRLAQVRLHTDISPG